MGRRSRKRRPTVPPAPAPAPRPPRVRGEARNQRVRAELEPLADGQRPTAVTVAAAVAVVMAVANVVAVFVAPDLSGDTQNAASFTVVSTALLLSAAYGMYRVRYWGVLGFEAILAFQIMVFAVALIRVEKWWVGVLVTVIIGLLGWLFWKLVRAMARIQMPERRVQ